MTDSPPKRNWLSAVPFWFFTLILAAIIALCIVYSIAFRKARTNLFTDDLLREYVRLQVLEGDSQGKTSAAKVRAAFEARRLDRANYATVNDFSREEVGRALDSLPNDVLYFTVHGDEELYYIVFTKEPFRVVSGGKIYEPEP